MAPGTAHGGALALALSLCGTQVVTCPGLAPSFHSVFGPKVTSSEKSSLTTLM